MTLWKKNQRNFVFFDIFLKKKMMDFKNYCLSLQSVSEKSRTADALAYYFALD